MNTIGKVILNKIGVAAEVTVLHVCMDKMEDTFGGWIKEHFDSINTCEPHISKSVIKVNSD